MIKTEEGAILKSDFTPRKEFEFTCGHYTLQLGRRTMLMGILNVTCDSFSNDGIYKSPEKAADLALEMVQKGADIIDVGGESTRPGAQPVSAEEQITRVLPVIKRLVRNVDVPVSVDTTKSEVAQAALDQGASIVNDISGLKFDSQMPKIIAQFDAGCILMHIKGTPQTMQQRPFYDSLIADIYSSLEKSVSQAVDAGIRSDGIIIDPGIGFGKTTEHNLQIIKKLNTFSRLNLPILIGTSRKSFIGNILNLPVQKRILGTAATVVAAIFNGAHIVRVHDVEAISQVVKMGDAILNS